MLHINLSHIISFPNILQKWYSYLICKACSMGITAELALTSAYITLVVYRFVLATICIFCLCLWTFTELSKSMSYVICKFFGEIVICDNML